MRPINNYDEASASAEYYLGKLLATDDPLEENELLGKIEIILKWAQQQAIPPCKIRSIFSSYVEKIEVMKSNSPNIHRIENIFALNLT